MVPIRVLWALKCVIYLLWPATAWATQITLGTTLMAVPALAWLMVFILATVSGLAALLNTLKTGLPKNWLVFVASHMAGSWLAGLLLFFAMEQVDADDLPEAITIALGAYAGARLIDRWSDMLVKKVTPGQC
jgi:LydA holin phage, holin superfamily III